LAERGRAILSSLQQRIDIHDLEDKLMSERQERLSLSDRLTAAQKAAKRSEADADSLRDRLSDLERRLAHDQRALSTSQRSVDTSKKEALELLSSVYVRVAKMTGSDVGGSLLAVRRCNTIFADTFCCARFRRWTLRALLPL
jgi:chromosome segregation ATPase